MSSVGPKSLFFLGLPEMTQLVCVTLSPQEEEQQEPRTNQIRTCRELVLLHSDVLACPALDSITDVTAVMSVHFLQRGVLQAFAIRNRLQLGGPHTAFPGDLQCCLSYSLISRLAPRWNKAGLYLISGADFLTRWGTLSAVSLEMNTSGGRLSLSIEASAVRTPPPTLDDLGLPAPLLQRFCSDPDFILDPSSTGGPIWCHVLPSMKKGQIISIGRQLPRDGPFRTYGDLQNHWNRLYGYRLPELEGGGVYCSVYFRPVGEKLFTYPLSCIRLQPVQRCPGGDLQGALARFLADSRERLQSVCGFPTRLTSKPSHPAAGLTPAASMKVLSWDQINRTIGPVLSQQAPSCRADPPAWVPLSQQGGALPGSRSGNSLWRRPEDRSAQPSSSQNRHQSDRSLFVSSFSQHFQPASSLPPLPQPSPVPVNPPPKLVPIFRNNDPTGRLSVALLRVQNRRSGGTEDKRRLTLPLPAGSQVTPSSSSSSSFSSSSSSAAPLPPPPRFARRPKSRSAAVPPPSGQSRVTRISSLSPVFKAKAAVIIPPRTKPKPSRTSGTVRPERAASRWKAARPETVVPRTVMKTSREAGPEGSTEPEPTRYRRETAASSRKTVAFELEEKPNKVLEEDVEKMARSNQWAGLSRRSLLLWLRNRRIPVSSKLRKEELMMKVMSCLAEA